MPTQHLFQARTLWTGAAAGPTRDLKSYSREIRIEIAGKPPLTVSAAPAFAGDPRFHDPESLLLCALSSCHLLSYLALCARALVAVTAYEDRATGTLGQVAGGLQFTDVLLRPNVRLSPGSDPALALSLHDRAHAACFIARSVNFPVRHEATVEVEPGSL